MKRLTCVLCGGDGFVSEETARQHGRVPPDTTCPACGGSGSHPGECRVPTRAEMEQLAKDFPQFVRVVEEQS